MNMAEVKTIASTMTFRGGFRDALFVAAGLAIGFSLPGIALMLGVLGTLMSFAELDHHYRTHQQELTMEFLRGYTMADADRRHKTVRQ